MNCYEARNDDTMERYLRGELSEEESQRLEEHYFSCDDCYEYLRDLSAVRSELSDNRWAVPEGESRLGWRGGWGWALAAAMVILAVGLIFLLREPTQSGFSDRDLIKLAAVEPASYRPLSLRGPDEEAEAFEEAMAAYLQGDFGAAAEGLEPVTEALPEDAAASFYLGVSYLLSERPEEAIDSLGHVIEMGESRYLDAALYYRAKALLRTGNAAAAREDFATVAAREGEWAAQAREILDQL